MGFEEDTAQPQALPTRIGMRKKIGVSCARETCFQKVAFGWDETPSFCDGIFHAQEHVFKDNAFRTLGPADEKRGLTN
jgi:hypothetical protein